MRFFFIVCIVFTCNIRFFLGNEDQGRISRQSSPVVDSHVRAYSHATPWRVPHQPLTSTCRPKHPVSTGKPFVSLQQRQQSQAEHRQPQQGHQPQEDRQSQPSKRQLDQQALQSQVQDLRRRLQKRSPSQEQQNACPPVISYPKGKEGVLTSPLFPENYPVDMDCWILMRAVDPSDGSLLPNFHLSVKFEFIDMEVDEGSSDKCAFDFIEFYDGPKQNMSTFIGKYCDYNVTRDNWLISRSINPDGNSSDQNGKLPEELTVSSSGPEMLLHFQSDPQITGKGYKAIVQVNQDHWHSATQCWQHDKEAQTLKSPEYPNNYPPDRNCSLLLRAPAETDKIALIFDSFYMEPEDDCQNDRLELYDEDDGSGKHPTITFPDADTDTPVARAIPGGEKANKVPRLYLSRRYCGQKWSRFKFVSHGPILGLRFISNGKEEFPGFSAKYSFHQDKSHRHDENKPKEPPFAVVPQNAQVISGSSHVLTCIPRQQELNQPVRWAKDKVVLSEKVAYENGTKLLIKEFNPTLNGKYVCMWKDNNATATLTAKPAACPMTFIKRPQNAFPLEGEWVQLDCATIVTNGARRKGRTTNITWFKDGEPLTDDESKVEVLRWGSIIVTQLNSSDGGFYTCRSTAIDNPSCVMEATAYINIIPRSDVDTICGRPITAKPSMKKPQGRIVSGAPVQKGAFPWQVMFQMRPLQDGRPTLAFCGGSVLNERWIISAAHCFPNPDTSRVVVKLGKYDQTVDEPEQFVTSIDTLIKHPEFNSHTFDNDIALIRVADRIPFTDHVLPICLGNNRTDMENTFFKARRLGTVTGWGLLSDRGIQPKLLQEVRLPIQQQSACRATTPARISDNLFCAGYGQELAGDACQGDSGGPFVAVEDDRWYLLGIVSFGYRCAQKGKYGFYTRVPNYLEWIRQFIN